MTLKRVSARVNVPHVREVVKSTEDFSGDEENSVRRLRQKPWSAGIALALRIGDRVPECIC